MRTRQSQGSAAQKLPIAQINRAAMIFDGGVCRKTASAVLDMRQKPSHAAAFAAALLGVLAAWGLRWLLRPVFSERLPFITFFPVTFLLAWWGGFWPTF